jgi:hypothetical protein
MRFDGMIATFHNIDRKKKQVGAGHNPQRYPITSQRGIVRYGVKQESKSENQQDSSHSSNGDYHIEFVNHDSIGLKVSSHAYPKNIFCQRMSHDGKDRTNIQKRQRKCRECQPVQDYRKSF